MNEYNKIEDLEDMDPFELKKTIIGDANIQITDLRYIVARIKDLEDQLEKLEKRIEHYEK